MPEATAPGRAPEAAIPADGAGAGPPATARRTLASSALLALLVLPFVDSIRPTDGLDPSWRLALSLAHTQGLDFGSDLVFTYGPLGFLDEPTSVFLPGAALALLWSAGVAFAFGWLLLRAATRWLPYPSALPLCVIAALMVNVGTSELAGLVVLLYGLELVSAPPRFWRRPQVALVLLGALAAVQLLTKFSVGVHAAGVAAIVALATPPSRRLEHALVTGGSLLGSLLVLWITAGQRLGDLVPWLRASVDIASGYSATMFRPVRGTLLVISAVTLLVAMAVALGRAASRRTVAGILLVAWTAWVYGKAGMVRAGAHFNITAAAAVTMLLAVAPRRPLPVRRRTGSFALAAAVALVPILLVPGGLGRVPGVILGGQARTIGSTATLVHELVDPELNRARLERTAAELRRGYRVEELPEDLPETLHALPWSVSAVWALDRTWAPPPVFQDYVAYTPYLDDLNRDHFEGPDAPEAILAANVSIDQRPPFWDAPAAQLEIVCRYAPAGLVGVFPLLVRHPDRCGDPEPLAELTVQPGVALEVPTAERRDTIVVASVDYPVDPARRVVTTLLQPFSADGVLITRSGVPPGTKPNRLVVATAGGPLLIRVPDLPERSLYRADIDVLTLTFPDAPGPVTVRFSEIPVAG